MKPTVYIETTVIGYLTSRPREDPIVAGHQDTTREWWQTAADRFELVASELVVQECAAGDQTAARERMEALQDVALLRTTSEADQLAAALLSGKAVPESHPEDALHIALAVVNGIEYLVSWNFRHIVNAVLRSTIERICLDAGYEPPTICTPEELLDTSDA